MLARLEAALERERRFVADASHELRTPLAALLKAELELALRRRRTEEELERALRSAAEETERLAQLAEDLLVLARADGGRLPVRRERLPAASCSRACAERFAARAAGGGAGARDTGRRGARARTATASAPSRPSATSSRTPCGTGASASSSRLVVAMGALELHVRDDGPGFPAEFLPHAFERFSRGDPARTGGAGLGLTIVHVIAEAHGGAAHAESGDGWTDVWARATG